MNNDISVPVRAPRLLWVVPLALLTSGIGLIAWTGMDCRTSFTNGSAFLIGVLAMGDALILAVGLRFCRFDSPRDAVLPTLGILGVTFLLGAIAIPNLVGALDRGQQKRTMGDMRTIATALEMRAGGRPEYPIARSGDIDALARELEPTYVKALPRLDGWKHAIRVESDGRSYTITSYGCCGEPDGPEVHVAPNGGTTTFSADIVFANGVFVKFPDGTQL